MKKYRNLKTGAVIEIRSELTGADWGAVQEQLPDDPAGKPEGQEAASVEPAKKTAGKKKVSAAQKKGTGK